VAPEVSGIVFHCYGTASPSHSRTKRVMYWLNQADLHREKPAFPGSTEGNIYEVQERIEHSDLEMLKRGVLSVLRSALG
jgi:hypothetical protein